jgi:hypothetical protein
MSQLQSDLLTPSAFEVHFDKLLSLDTPVEGVKNPDDIWFGSPKCVKYIEENDLNGKYFEDPVSGKKIEFRISVDERGKIDQTFVWVQERYSKLLDKAVAKSKFNFSAKPATATESSK